MKMNPTLFDGDVLLKEYGEQENTVNEVINGVFRYVPNDARKILYQGTFHCTDLGTQLAPIVKR